MSQNNGYPTSQNSWIGQEISCRIVIPIFQMLEEKGIAPQIALEGVCEPLSHLLDKHQWISWGVYTLLLDNLEEVFSEAEWEMVGYRVVKHQFFKPMVLMLKYLTSPLTVFEYGTVKDGKVVGHRLKDRMLFSCMQARSNRSRADTWSIR